ncbi:molecular chaperone [Chloroflexota bacterium]
MPEPVINDMSPLAPARSRVYELLASVYNLLPDTDFVTTVVNQDIRSLLSSAIGDYPASEPQQKELEQGIQALDVFQRQACAVNLEELITRLGIDRTRLFRGLKRGYGPPPPYESVYMGGHTVMGESALDVKKAYSSSGYLPQMQNNEPPDYIGIELDFLRFLCSGEAEAWGENDHGKAFDLLQKEKDFLQSHVATWAPKFCEEVINHAREDFYQGIAKLNRAFILIEAERLQGLTV